MTKLKNLQDNKKYVINLGFDFKKMKEESGFFVGPMCELFASYDGFFGGGGYQQLSKKYGIIYQYGASNLSPSTKLTKKQVLKFVKKFKKHYELNDEFDEEIEPHIHNANDYKI